MTSPRIHLAAITRRPTITPDELRNTRESWSLSQTELGALLGVSVATVCRWERQRLRPEFEQELPHWLPYALIGLHAWRQDNVNFDTIKPGE